MVLLERLKSLVAKLASDPTLIGRILKEPRQVLDLALHPQELELVNSVRSIVPRPKAVIRNPGAVLHSATPSTVAPGTVRSRESQPGNNNALVAVTALVGAAGLLAVVGAVALVASGRNSEE